MNFADVDVTRGLAVVGTPQGFLVGIGPFRWSASPSETGISFYWTNFRQDIAEPWFQPAEFIKVSASELLAGLSLNDSPFPEIEWQPIDKQSFVADFETTQRAIEQQLIKKSVPVAIENGRLVNATSGALAGLARALLTNVVTMGARFAALEPYFFAEGDRLIAGLSPEVLFESSNGHDFTTHALAATQKRGERSPADFLNLAKEGQEQNIVLEGIRQDLFKLGLKPVAQERRVKTLPTLEHIETPLQFHCDHGLSTAARVDELVRHLHPSPALGVYPKTSATLDWLYNLAHAGARQSHGSPIGYVDADSGACSFIVAIRAVQVTGDLVTIVAGCGITSDSKLEAEWQELEHKRSSVKKLLVPEIAPQLSADVRQSAGLIREP